MKSALIVGATGLVGRELAMQAIHAFQNVTVAVRKKTDFPDEIKQVVIDFEDIMNWPDTLKADHIFCCLGTTIKKAGSKDAFTEVDYDYPVRLAALAKKWDSSFYLITAANSDPSSALFYSRIKGKLEQKVMQMNLRDLHIFRPSLLLGKRNEFRMGESIASVTRFFPLPRSLKKYKPVHASIVARAMIKSARQKDYGIYFHESDRIQKDGAT